MMEAATVLVGALLGLTPDLDSEIFVLSTTSSGENALRRRPLGAPEGCRSRLGPGEPGVVPGSMGTPTFHVEGPRKRAVSLLELPRGGPRDDPCEGPPPHRRERALRRQLRGVWFDIDARTPCATRRPPPTRTSAG